MPNTNFQTFHQMGNAISNVVKQASGRDPVQNIDMDFVTVAQNKTLGEMTYTGNPVSFNTPRPVQIQRILLGMNPKQNLNGYNNVWPAGGGKNIAGFDVSFPQTSGGITITKNDDGSITIDGTANENVNIVLMSQKNCETGTWTISGVPENSAGGNFSIWMRNASGGGTYARTYNGNNGTFNNEAGTVYIYCTVSNGTTVDSVKCFIQLEKGSTATAWAPYSNICPISGWTGVNVSRTGINLLDPAYREDETSNIRYYRNNKRYFPAGTYTLSSNKQMNEIYVIDSTGTIFTKYNANSLTFTIAEGKELSFNFYKIGGIEEDTTCQLEVGSSASEHEEYSGTTIPIVFSDPPGTVYQGTLDLISGQLTITHLMQTFTGVESEEWLNSYGNNGFRISSRGMKAGLLNPGLCNWLPVLSAVGNNMGVALGMNDSDIYVRHITDNLEIADLTEWKAYLAEHPLEVFYPLEPAQYYQVTPQNLNTLAGDNVIWTDADTMEVMYYQYGEVI